MLSIYCTGHRWSTMVCKAFARGTKAPIVPHAPLLPGDAFFYGCLRGLMPTIQQAMREKRTYYYGDNGYMRPGKNELGHFRITKNALQHTGTGDFPIPEALAYKRFKGLGLEIKKWRKNGKHVLVCPPMRLSGAVWGYDSDKWLADTLETLKKHTDRELRVRAKMSWNDNKGPNTASYEGRPKTELRTMAEDLDGAWALVSYNSNAATEALLAGVPVFNAEACGSYAMGTPDLSKIETPRMDGDRHRWAAMLACNQWTLEEMRNGTAWKMLNP